MKKEKLSNYFKIFFISGIFTLGLFLSATNNGFSQADTTTICPGVKCLPPCTGLEGSNCTCLPLGCEVPSLSNPGLSLDTKTPFCVDSEIMCNTGIPFCKSGKPTCGSKFGYSGDLAGPGCKQKYAGIATSFYRGTALCGVAQAKPSPKKKCKTKNLCTSKQRSDSCSPDRTLCKCICPF